MVINTTILDKFGWNYGYRKFYFCQWHDEDIIPRYSYLDDFCITYNDDGYFFIKRNGEEIKKYKFVNNGELFSLIIKNNAFNQDYQRHFKINKILK